VGVLLSGEVLVIQDAVAVLQQVPTQSWWASWYEQVSGWSAMSLDRVERQRHAWCTAGHTREDLICNMYVGLWLGHGVRGGGSPYSNMGYLWTGPNFCVPRVEFGFGRDK